MPGWRKACSRTAGQRKRRGPRGGAAPLLRRYHPSRAAPVPVERVRRRVFGEYQPTEPSRFLDEIPRNWSRRSRRRAPPTPAAGSRSSRCGPTPTAGVRGRTRTGTSARAAAGSRARPGGPVPEPARPATRASPPTRLGAASSARRTRTSPPRRPAATRQACVSATPVRRRHGHRGRGRRCRHEADRPVRQRGPEEADGPVRQSRARLGRTTADGHLGHAPSDAHHPERGREIREQISASRAPLAAAARCGAGRGPGARGNRGPWCAAGRVARSGSGR